MMTSQDPPRSRVHELGRMSRTDLITHYQGQHRYDCYEVGGTDAKHLGMDRDHLIEAILEGEACQDPAKLGAARQGRTAWSRSAAAA